MRGFMPRWTRPAKWSSQEFTTQIPTRPIKSPRNITPIFCRSISEAAENSDAINIATPTTTHFEIAKQLLAHGKHVFVEKPMTDDTAQAAELIRLAQENKCVLQVGHVERFNPVFKYLEIRRA